MFIQVEKPNKGDPFFNNKAGGGTSSVFRSATCGLYIANEGMSILENAGKLGLPMPKKLKEVLEQLRDKEDDDDQNAAK